MIIKRKRNTAEKNNESVTIYKIATSFKSVWYDVKEINEAYLLPSKTPVVVVVIYD